MITGADLHDLAREATPGYGRAFARFRRLANAAGYIGRSGGWIYDESDPGAPIVTQGYANLACMVRVRPSGRIAQRIIGRTVTVAEAWDLAHELTGHEKP